MATQTRDHWTWDPAGPMVSPIFDHAAARRDHLLQKQASGQPLTESEAKELADGYPPYFYAGCTFFGVLVQVSKSRDDGTIHNFLVNNPLRWEHLSPPLSIKNYPDGPPGWQPLAAGIHYPITKIEGNDLYEPWDVTWQRQISTGTGAGTGV